MTIQEKEVEAYLRRAIQKRGGMFIKFTSPGMAGVPDRIAILPGGRVWFVELKTEHGRLSEIQKYVIRAFDRLDCNVAVIHGKREAESWLREVANEIRSLSVSESSDRKN